MIGSVSFIFIGIIAALVVGVVLIVMALLHRMRQHGRLLRSLNLTLLLVLLPHGEGGETRGIDDMREQISAAEQLYAALSRTLYDGGAWQRFWYGPTAAALEIATTGGDISFYLAIPRSLRGVVEKNIYATYPDAEIVDADDYTVFQPGSAVVISEAKMTLSSLLPIRTYQKLENDPLNAITSVMHEANQDSGEGVAVQIMFWPYKGFERGGGKVASLMHQKQYTFDQARSKAGESTAAGIFSSVTDARSVEQKKKAEEDRAKQLSPQDQERMEGISSKASKPAFHVNVRLVASAPERDRAEILLNHLEGGFGQFASPQFNSLDFYRTKGKRSVREFIFRTPSESSGVVLNTEELASIYHFPLASVSTPSIKRLEAKAAPAPSDLPEEGVLVLGRNVYRGEERVVSFASRADRRRHLYTLGQTGTGKSVFLQNLAVQDIYNGEGVCVIDPHGDLIDDIMSLIPDERADDVVLFDPSDVERPVGLNMLEYHTEEQKDFAVQEMIAIFEKLFPPEYIGPMFEHYMRNAMLLLMADRENPGTLIEIPRVFTDDAFVALKLKHVTDPVVRNFWEREWKQTTGQQRSEMLGYLVSKIGRFAENEMMRNIIGQPKSGFDVRSIMDEGKILLVNLSKGKTGEVNSSLLGLVLVSKIQMAALARAGTAVEDRRDFYLYIDEFQNFTTDSISTILSEARKYRLVLSLGHQFIAQLEQPIRDSVFGNVGTIVAFRVGPEDAEVLEKHFEPVFSAHDMVNLDNYNAYCRLMLNGKASRAFSFLTYAPEEGEPSRVDALRQQSRERFGRDRTIVAQEIVERSQLGVPLAPDPRGMGPQA